MALSFSLWVYLALVTSSGAAKTCSVDAAECFDEEKYIEQQQVSLLQAQMKVRKAGYAGKMMHTNVQKPSILAAYTSVCPIDPSQEYIAAYCKSNSLDKVLVSDEDCNGWWWGEDEHDAIASTLGFCHSGGYKGCHVEDRGGSACFTCGISDFQDASGDTVDWGLYCAASTPKQWFMTADCKGASWHTGKNNVPDGMMLYSYNGYQCPDTGVVGDMRAKIEGCLQYESAWCWATSIIIVAGYYQPATFPNHDSAGPNCHGETCKVVNHLHFPADPGKCCKDRDSCNQDGTGADMVKGLTYYTGRPWVYVPQLNETLLKKILQDKNPVAFSIAYAAGGGHAMVIAGTDGKGLFYVFDPFFVHGRGSFQSLTYDGLYHYKTPGYTGEDPSFGSGTMNGAYVPSEYAVGLQLVASPLLAPQVLASRIRKKGLPSSI